MQARGPRRGGVLDQRRQPRARALASPLPQNPLRGLAKEDVRTAQSRHQLLVRLRLQIKTRRTRRVAIADAIE
ncbi:MAG: hypothetical protein ACK55I_04620, partial [bacterium]